MAKVIFEFDDIENKDDILAIVNRHKLILAVNQINNLFRKIYNGKIYNPDNCIYLKADGSKATDEDYERVRKNGEYLSGGKHYLLQEYIENELKDALDGLDDFIY